MPRTLDVYPQEYFKRQDETPDTMFYEQPRRVVHIDDEAILTLSRFYADVLPPKGAYLDLMASWRSHLPIPLVKPDRVVGLGMNAAEMNDNPHLDEGEIWVHNLNEEPLLPFADGEFDAVLCAVSIQYLIQPLEVFQEVNRILKPGGVFAISFSNRCFPIKATAVWLATNDQQHIELVASYFVNSEGWGEIQARVKNQETGSPAGEDPLYILWASKEAGE